MMIMSNTVTMELPRKESDRRYAPLNTGLLIRDHTPVTLSRGFLDLPGELVK